MKSISPELEAHIKSEASTLATLWKIVRKDGVISGYTSHDNDIFFNGQNYLSSRGFTPTSVDNSSGMKVDNLEVVSIIDDSVVSADDIEAGLYDFASIEIFEVNYRDLAMGSVGVKKGQFGNVVRTTEKFITEVRGQNQLYTSTITKEYSPTCRVALGSAKCGVNINTFTYGGSITSINNDKYFLSDLIVADPQPVNLENFFKFGLLTFTSGLNSGYSVEIKAYDKLTSGFELFLKMTNALQVGDTFSVYAGCNKKFDICKLKFNNGPNFRGEPRLPGRNKIIPQL